MSSTTGSSEAALHQRQNEPNSKEQIQKQRIVSHMNSDHRDSLSMFLVIYNKVPYTQAQTAQIEEIRLSGMTISTADYPDRAKSSRTNFFVPFEPALNGYEEARHKVVEMHKHCLKTLGQSDITIQEYRRPRGFSAFMFTVCLVTFIAFSRRSNFQPGSELYSRLLQYVPDFATFCYKIQPLVIGGTLRPRNSRPVLNRLSRPRQLNDIPARCSGERPQLFEWSCLSNANMGISRDSRHKRSATGAKRATYRKKRAFEKGRQPANTRIGPKRVHLVRTRGGNTKYRGLRLDSGNFSWGSEGISRKVRVIVVAFHPSNNELVRTNTLTRSAVVQVDAAPFRQWYEAHYGQPIGRRRQQKSEVAEEKKSKSVESKQAARFAASGKVENALERQFEAGRLYAVISSRPGQSGRVDGYILEGEELAFYQRAIRK
ncbi:ribosomal protein S8A [Talaromyces marneffei ATCC 18224]|nr:uncharacterized protein EYB26_008223 [Talaromyces marneffei]KAE8550852.1 hypothetical protein EYB25_007083 [Talaromyces marneffei]QGA20518.1 hypothetical protein EYB26_008223 [Talaromyces marneffei]